MLDDANAAGQDTSVKQADNAATSLTSTNVSQTINKKSISDIFEEDGVTVKKSTMSDNALSTDFTSSEWIWIENAESGVDLVGGGTYEICVYGNKVAQVIIGYYIITIEANPSNFGISMTIKNSFSPASLSGSEWEIDIQKANVKTRRIDTVYYYNASSGKFSVSSTTQQYLDFKYRRIK